MLEPRGEKFAKVPVQLNGRRASVAEPRHWVSFRAARASQVGDGLGWVLGAGIGCIDLDDCLNGDRIEPWAAELVRKYRHRALLIERSVSGTGVHIFLRMKPGAGRRIRDGRNIEVYPPDSGRYIAVTGRRFDLEAGGVVVDRELKPCGTPAAARRHRRRKEQVCKECLAAERADKAASRAMKRQRARDAAAAKAEELPEKLDQRAELRFMYARIKRALHLAEPKEVATLVKQGEIILERIARLDGAPAPAPDTADSTVEADELDRLRQERQDRRAMR